MEPANCWVRCGWRARRWIRHVCSMRGCSSAQPSGPPTTPIRAGAVAASAAASVTAADLSSPRKRGRAAADAGAAVASGGGGGGGGGAGGGSAGGSGGHTHDVRRCVFDAIVLPPPAAPHTPVATPRRLTALQFQFARAEATVNAVYDEDFESWTAASMCLRECASSGAPPYVCSCARGSRLADRKHAEPNGSGR